MTTPWPLLPMKATSGRLPSGEGWAFEPKWDGHRALVRVRGDRLDVLSSTGKDRSGSWPFLDELVPLRLADTVLDGEVVAYDEDGRHRFQLVGRPGHPHAFVVFDVLAHDGADLRQRPWRERRDLVQSLVPRSPHVFVTPVSDDAGVMMEVTRSQGFEGVIAKRADSRYVSGKRSTSWIKIKHRNEQELVIGGYLVGTGRRAGTFGSLLVGVYEDGALRFAGGVGTGFDDRTLDDLRARLDALAVEEPPFEPVPGLPRGQARWVRPELVAQVSFAEWTEDGRLRHPVFLGLRDDRDPASVVREP